ncbi:uncharacterized protein [Haliotis cracherodii]|uniref:uncharacterized protein n=1 Tax=Haliotis cracherodii TaxID=6455 RepID=UPI0039E8211E
MNSRQLRLCNRHATEWLSSSQDAVVSTMPEWLREYERVAVRQQEYLQRIKDLRRSLENRDEHFMMIAIERMRTLKRGRFRDPKYPEISQMPRKMYCMGPEAFPQRSCVLHERQGRFYMAPNVLPRKLAPLVKNKRRLAPLPPYGPVDRLKTDYEPIESIAARNKINLQNYVKVNQGDKGSSGPSPRQPLSITTVTVQSSDDEGDVEDVSMEYITDVSSRKTIVDPRRV